VTWPGIHDSALFVIFDADDGSARNKITTIFSGALIKPGVYPEAIDHDSVLRTIEDACRLAAVGTSAHRSPSTGPWTTGRK
jgi:acid phosphatase